MPTGPAEALLLDIFGSSFLTYVCAVDEATLLARLDGAAELPAEAEAAFQGLVPIAEHVAEEVAKHERGPSAAFFLQILRFDAQTTTVGHWNAFRMAAGGSLPQPSYAADDELASLLLQLALVQYPSFLLPRNPADPSESMGFSLFNHPLRPRLVELIAVDEGLSQLFTDDDPGLGRRGFVYTSLGHGFTLQSVMLGEMLLRSSWDAASMSMMQPTFELLCQEVLRSLEAVRSAAGGDVTRVRALVAFTGITTGGAGRIDTPWGELRPLSDAERRAAPPSLSGAVSGTDAQGNHTPVSYAGELILDTELPYSVSVQAESQVDRQSWQWPKLQGADDLRHRLEAIQLSALFSVVTPPGSLVAARPAWAWIADPLTHGPRIRSWNVRSGPGFMPYHLKTQDRDELGRWCERIAAHRSPTVDIAIRRVISVAQARTEAADRLVDAVIAWENLFGTSEGEPRLRITAAMAWLLEPDSPSGRESLQLRLKALYDTRSKIVHGNPVDERIVAEQANEAFGFAAQALAALFRDRPDVLALPDGAARSLRLMLGGRSNNTSKE